MDDGGEEVVGVGSRLLELGFEVVAEVHELIDLGDDAFLLAEWGKRNMEAKESIRWKPACAMCGPLNEIKNAELVPL